MKKKLLPDWRKVNVNSYHYAKLYKETYENVGLYPVSEEYIFNCHSNLFYFKEKLVGGFIINDGIMNPLRYFSIIKTDEEIDLLLDIEDLEEAHLMEISCIFLDKKIAPVYRVLFYVDVLSQTYKFARFWNKKGILGGSFEKKIQLMQMKLMPHIILKTVINKSLKITGHPKGLVMLYYCPTNEFIFRAISVIIQYSFLKLFKKTSKSN
ncbi:hypothetical protein LV89_04033 [Arcicella aurantiaca]|uniref:Uncharacterized protein n=1 Tax=Arcicella aurantiaca TaxID=591202 RepID=A0A316DMV8_9BACT|nr:hypothetical protein [Arcicella aurantiaca]PWK18898.1 hypothetical protein LV89_04033 [Arcicella aurantiaca]